MPVTTAEGIFEELKKIPLKTLSFCVSSQFLYRFSFFVQLNCAFVDTYYISQPSRGVPRNRCSENMQQIYRRTPMRNLVTASDFDNIRQIFTFCKPFLQENLYQRPSRPSRISTMKLFCNFRKEAPQQLFDCVLNTHLYAFIRRSVTQKLYAYRIFLLYNVFFRTKKE